MPGTGGRGHEIVDGKLAAVQNQFSPAFRSSEVRLREGIGTGSLPRGNQGTFRH
jgi:hypothetical protein